MDIEKTSKTERIIAARLKLRDRFLKKINTTPSLADPKPMGTGNPNRHKMPKLPPDQTETKKWPVLDLGVQPTLTRENWCLSIDGLVDNPVNLNFEMLQAEFQQRQQCSDFHCVTGWSKMDMQWRGVGFLDLAAYVGLQDQAHHVLCHGSDGYTTNLPLIEALKEDVLIVYEVEGEPLPREHGGPVRMITPQLWAWKGAKWIERIEFLAQDQKGFWELRGYSNTAYPWKNDRYS